MTFAPIMRILILLAMLIGISSCDRSRSVDHDVVIKWSQQSDVQLRQKGATFMAKSDEGRWISISTSVMEETKTGLMYSGGEILKSGFLVYPGSQRVGTIEEAIRVAAKLPGAEYQSEQAGGR